jgi:hypothetical protein
MIICEKYTSVSAWDHATDVDARITFGHELGAPPLRPLGRVKLLRVLAN